MNNDYIKIFNELFYDVQKDEEMNALVADICEWLGSVIIKYGEVVNEFQYRKEEEKDVLTDMVVALFLRKVMEHIDAIIILIEKSAFSQAQIILRTLLETVVSLKFILKEDTERRAAAYYLYHHYEELEKISFFDERKKIGKMMKENIGEEAHKDVLKKIEAKKEAFKRLIANNDLFKEIDDLRNQKIKEKIKKYPKEQPHIQWYQICGSVKNFAGLMRDVGWQTYYSTIYGGMSMETHGYNATVEVVPDKDGLHMKCLRNPLNGYSTVELTGTFSVSALNDVYEYLQDGKEEREEFREYYRGYMEKRKYIQTRYEQLVNSGE